jgi:4-amino-4-deoxy-L-arabinose transferase-like glycosyltransferase
MILSEFFSSAVPSDRTDSRFRAAPIMLVLIALALFLPGFFRLQPMDRDEPRFAQASKQMLESGDYVSIRFQDEARNKKPVGIYWAQAGIVHVAEVLGVRDARETIWLYRIPSMLGALATVMLTYWTALAFGGRRMAFIAGLMLATTVVLGVEARLAKTDAVTAATVVAAMGVLARLWLRRRIPGIREHGLMLAGIFWTALAVGVLVKGPITPMVVALALIVLIVHERSARWLLPLRPIPGLLLFLLLVSPWFVMIMLRTNGAFLTESLGRDMLQKVAGGVETHGAPPATYLLAFFGTAWPMAPFAALATPFVWAQRRDLVVVFLLAWLVPSWLLFEIVPTKLPHYVLPLYPAIALMVGYAAERGALLIEGRWRTAVACLVPAVAIILMIAGAGASVWVGTRPGWPFFLAIAPMAWLILQIIRQIRAPQVKVAPELYAMSSAGLALLTYIAIYGGLLTGSFAQPFALSPRIAGAIATMRASTGCTALPVSSVGYREPSFVFLTGTETQLSGGTAGAARFVKDGSCRVAVVERSFEPEFLAALGADPAVHLVSRVQGLNFNKRSDLDFGIYLHGRAP